MRGRKRLLTKYQHCMTPFLLSLLAKYQQTVLNLAVGMFPLLAKHQQTYPHSLSKLMLLLGSLLAKVQQWGVKMPAVLLVKCHQTLRISPVRKRHAANVNIVINIEK